MRKAGRWALASICVSLAVSIVSGIIGVSHEEQQMLYMFFIPQVVGFLLPAAIVGAMFRREAAEMFSIRPIRAADALLVIGMTVFSRPIIVLIASLASFIFPDVISDTVTDFVSNQGYIVSLLSICLLPAICEEAVSRGVFLYGYKNAPWWKACLMTGVFFGMLHLNAQQFLYVLPMGFLLALYVRSTGSIFAAVLGHFMNNAIDITLASIQDYAEKASGMSASEIDAAAEAVPGIVYVLIFVVFTCIFAFLLFAFIRRNKGRLFAKPAAAESNGAPESELADIAITGPMIITFVIFLAMSALTYAITLLSQYIPQ